MTNKSSNYKYLGILSQGLLAFLITAATVRPAQAADASAAADAARLKREAAEMNERQVEAARGYSDFIQAVRKSSPGTPLSANQHLLLPGQSGVYSVIQARREEEAKRISDKVYNANGEVVGSAKGWQEPPSSGKGGADDEDPGTTGKSTSSGNKKALGSKGGDSAQPFVSTTGPGARAPGAGRPVQTLDGSDVPKELRFGGSQKSADKP